MKDNRIYFRDEIKDTNNKTKSKKWGKNAMPHSKNTRIEFLFNEKKNDEKSDQIGTKKMSVKIKKRPIHQTQPANANSTHII